MNEGKTTTALRGLALVAATALLAATARADDDDVGARNWNMIGGGPDRTSRVTCEPIRRQPVEAWRLELPRGVRCEPVVWDGTLFVLTLDDDGRNLLLAIDAQTGEEKTRKLILGDVQQGVSLLAWQGTVVLSEPGEISGYIYKGDSFKRMWRKRGDYEGHPGLCRDLLLAQEHGRFYVWDVRRGRPVDLSFPGKGLAGVSLEGPGDAVVAAGTSGFYEGYEGIWIRPRITKVTDLTKRNPARKAAWNDDRPEAALDTRYTHDMRYCIAVRVDAESPHESGWFFWHGSGFLGKEGTYRGISVPDFGESGLVDAEVVPAVFDGHAYTFDQQHDLIAADVTGAYRTIVANGDQPAAAWRGWPSIAQNVIHFGNWAVDLESRRVLWVHETKETLVLPSLPAGDGVLVLRTKEGDLIGLADPDVARKANAPDTSEAEVALPLTPLPAARTGLLLRDGTEVEGTVSRKGDGYRVIPPRGDPVSIPAADVLVAANRDGVLSVAADGEVYHVLEQAARAAVVQALEDVFEQAVRMEIPNAAGSVLEEAREWGMTESRSEELAAQLAGKRLHPNADLRRTALDRRWTAARADTAERIIACARWCADRELGQVAAGLVAIAQRLHAGHEDIQSLAAATIPREFPWKHDAEAWRLWLRWAPQMLPADARFLGEDDPAWNGREGDWARRKGAFGFRTPHLLLFSRSTDVDAIGPCLRYGEAAVQGLQQLLDEGEAVEVRSDADRLDVRIHRNRKEFMEERTGGGTAPTWSLGYYAPWENVSRFYVPDANASSLPQGRGLFKVLAHELTHHYIDARWVPRKAGKPLRSPALPGYWIVEGMARYVEDQMVDADTRGLTFDDHTVQSIDATAQLAKGGHALPIATLVDMSQLQFGGLGDDTVAEITLRRSLLTFEMSRINVFYEQAGALTFFLLRERGEEGRKRAIDYLLRYYTGRSEKKGWEILGFDSPRDLDRAFREFLAKLK